MKNDIENINDDFIKTLNNKGGFNVPNDYFEQSSKNILANINKANFLNSHKNENGFTIPENYFETNKEYILSKIKQKNIRKISLFTDWKFAGGIAALLIATATILFVLNRNNKSFEANIDKISNEEMVNYLAKNDIKMEWLNEVSNKIEVETIENKSNKEFEQYLIEHADEQFLLDEL